MTEQEQHQVWYSNSLEVLSPFRYYSNNVIENSMPYSNHHVLVRKSDIEELQKVLDRAENFFVRGIYEPD